MIELALAGSEWMSVDESEIQRGGISYTVDTLRDLSKAYPGSKLYFIIGSDSLSELWTWRSIRKIAKMVTFVTVRRKQGVLPQTGPELESKLQGTPLKSLLLPAPPLPVSSTQVRACIAQGLPIDTLVPPPVAAYIDQHGLYG
jgi:nicotinate-nucleotide adenylyltransferase